MARARNIKPSFFLNEELAEMPFEGRLLFIGLWTLADREGRLEDRPRRIKAQIFPFDGCGVDAGLAALAEAGFIQRYEVGGERLIQVVNFTRHQNPHQREAASSLPPPNPTPTPPAGLVQPNHGQGTAKDMPSHSQDPLVTDSPLLIPDSPFLDSVANATGAGAPPKTLDEMNRDELWTAGVSLLVQSGLPEKQCRAALGKLVKDYTQTTVLEAVRAAVLARPADALPYLVAACQGRVRPIKTGAAAAYMAGLYASANPEEETYDAPRLAR